MDFYVFSNLHISLAAGIFILSAFILYDIPVEWNYVWFIVSGTFIIYSLHRYVALIRISRAHWSNRHLIIKNARYSVIFFLIIAGVAGIYTILQIPPLFQKHLIIPVSISFLYVVPTLFNKRLRDLPFLKIILIASTWSYFYIIPLEIAESSFINLILTEKFCFIFGLTIPFDNRDRQVDQNHKLKTFANVISPKSSIFIAILFISLSIVLSIILYYVGAIDLKALFAILIGYLIVIILIYYSDQKKDSYYLGYLDGCILLQGLSTIFITIF